MKRLFNAFLTLIFFTSFACAHPHTFIEVFPTVTIKNEKISTINVKWVMDEMTSSMLIMDLDTNFDGKIDKAETLYAYENYFLSLGDYGFYTTVEFKNKKEKIEPRNFELNIKNQKIIYSFDLVKNYPSDKFKINFFDKDLFVGFILEDKFIKIKGLDKTKVSQTKKQIFGTN